MTTRWLALLVALSFFACSSKEKVNPNSNHDSGGKQSSMAQGADSDVVEDDEIELSDEEQRPMTDYAALDQALRDGSHTRVLNESSKLLAINKNDIRALSALAQSYFEKKKYGMTETLLARAFKIQPDNASFYNMLGLIYLDRKQQGKAMTAFKKGEESDNSHQAVAMNLGSIYAQFGDYEKAALRFGKLDVQEIREPQLLNNVAVTFWRTAKIESANEAFELLIEKQKRPEYLYNYASYLVDAKQDLSKADEQLRTLSSMRFSKALRSKVDTLKKKVSRRLAKAGGKK